jgi:hypothetical protein
MFKCFGKSTSTLITPLFLGKKRFGDASLLASTPIWSFILEHTFKQLLQSYTDTITRYLFSVKSKLSTPLFYHINQGFIDIQ